jgi:hypothetical protein
MTLCGSHSTPLTLHFEQLKVLPAPIDQIAPAFSSHRRRFDTVFPETCYLNVSLHSQQRNCGYLAGFREGDPKCLRIE